ncbi:MAG: histidine phosphatase family protein, partial [Acidimicrobiales bacterium]
MLYLVRNGRTAHNASDRLLGRMDVPLDDLGRRQAEALGRVPCLRQAARVVTSPLARARDTASALGHPVEVDERWTELDYGIYDGMPLDAVPDLWRSWSRDPSFTPEGVESLAVFCIRVRV